MANGSNIAEAILRLDASQIPGEAAKAATAIGNVEAAHRRASQAATEEARETEAAMQRVARVVAEARAATARLEGLAASSEAERAAIAYRRQANEIERLAQVSGRADLAQRAMVRLNAEAAERLQVTTTATHRLADAQIRQADTAAVAVRGSGAVGAGLFSLGQQAQDVAVQLSMGANPILVLAQQGPQIATAVSQVGGLSATFSALGAILSPLLPVVVGLAGAFALFGPPLLYANYQLEQMEEKADKAAAAATRLADARKGWIDARESIALDVSIAAGEITEAEAAFIRAEDAYRKARDAGRRVLADTVAAAEGADPNARTSAPAPGTIAARQSLEAYNQATERYASLAGMVAQKRIEDANAAKEQTAAIKDGTRALREEEQALQAMLAASQGRSFDPSKPGTTAQALQSAEAAIALSRGELTQQDLTLVQLEAMGVQVAEATAARAEGYVKEQEHLANLVAGMNAYTDATQEAVNAQKGISMEGVAGGINMVNAGPQGAMSAVAATGPWGAIAVALVQLVVNLEDIVGQFTDFHVKFMEALGNLPATLAKVIPDALIKGTEAAIKFLPTLIASFAEAIPEFAMAMVQAVPEMAVAFIEELVIGMPVIIAELIVTLTDPATWKEVGKAFVEGVKDAWFGLGESAGSSQSSLTSSAATMQQRVDSVFGGGKGSSNASKSRTSGSTIIFNAPVLGIGPDTGDALAAEMATIAGRRRPA